MVRKTFDRKDDEKMENLKDKAGSAMKDHALSAKRISPKLATLSNDEKNKILKEMAHRLVANKEEIFAANDRDMKNAEVEGVAGPILARLHFDQSKLDSCIQGIHDLIGLPDPVGKIQLKRELDQGLLLERISCPIGVIGVIFEARPDALIQISALCLKSGNVAILKGGSEARETNRCLFDILHQTGIEAGLPEDFLVLVESREDVNELLALHQAIDLIIPRGSNTFVQHIMANSKIPVMGHADGICHIYVDDEADLDLAGKIIYDAKTQYVAACNAVETLLVHESIADKVRDLISPEITVLPYKKSQEFLDYKLSFKMVSGLEEAIDFINIHGSHHTDCILSENMDKVEQFMNEVDSAGVYHNCSTRFADGFRYGFGAEVGISTGKLHARGPVGLEGLVTYKYKLHGHGQIVADYASGKSTFKFKDL